MNLTQTIYPVPLNLVAPTWSVPIIEPFPPSPPFGETAGAKRKLDTRTHLAHCQGTRWHRTYLLPNGRKEILAQPCSSLARKPRIRKLLMTHMRYWICSMFWSKILRWRLILGSQLDNRANDVSEYATSNLFSWYRSNEDGGLWLAEGQEDVGTTRKTNSHLWISHDSDEKLSSIFKRKYRASSNHQ